METTPKTAPASEDLVGPRYQALASRDSRFDGEFFVGVRTTGIYCRPICPARTPHRKNVTFYECAAAAETAGYRPCRRCRPETAPGTPAWRGTSATVSRALRLISDGALDRSDVESLATRVGVGDRQLRRLFEQHLGASPRAVAQTRRVHFARRLLDQTDLPMSEVALSAGFASVRRFNAAMRDTFHLAPTELRRRHREAAPAEGRLELHLPYRAPYDADSVLAYLGARAAPGVEQVEGRTYRRTFRLGDRVGIVEIEPAPGAEAAVLVRVPSDLRRRLLDVAERVRRVFDLEADPARISGRLSDDPRLARAVRARPGLRVPGAWDPFELAVRAVLGQQISVRGATTLAGRLAAAFGEELPAREADASGSRAAEAGDAAAVSHPITALPDRLFPTPDALAAATPGAIAAIGLPRKRAATIREVARRVRDGSLSLSGGECPRATAEALKAIPGIGDWTASYVVMRGLGHPDAFPAGDLGVRKALADADGKLPGERETIRRAERWRPWRAYATLHLWTLLSDEETKR